MRLSPTAACLALCLCTLGADALKVTKSIGSSKPWQFLGWFTFDRETAGSAVANATTLSWEWSGSPIQDGLELRLYDDQAESFPEARKYLEDGYLGVLPDVEAVCRYTGDVPIARAADTTPAATRHVQDSVRPRVWYAYLAVSDCGSGNATGIPSGGEVTVHFRNAGGFFRAEFGVDQQWVLETLIAAAACTFVLAAGYLLSLKAQRVGKPGGGGVVDNEDDDEPMALADGPGFFHPLMKHFVATVLLHFVAYCFLMFNAVKLAATGESNEGLRVCGLVMEIAATLMFLLLILVFAMGWKVVDVAGAADESAESVQRRRRELGVVFAVFLGLHCALIAAQIHMDGWATTYPYATWPGVALALLRVPMLAYYLYSLRATTEVMPEEEQTCAFKATAAVFAAQLAALPVLVLVAVLVDPWVRYKVVFMTDTLLRLVGLVTMACVLWPSERSRLLLSSGYEHVSAVVSTDAQDLLRPAGLTCMDDNDEDAL